MTPKPPVHLLPETANWWRQITKTYELEGHHLRLLQLACEAWDRVAAARAVLSEEGMVYHDRFGAPRARPECAIERNSMIAFARLLRELDLDVAPPASAPRPPPLRANRR